MVLEQWAKPWINYWTVTGEQPISAEHRTPTHLFSNSLSDLTATLNIPKPIEDYACFGDLYTDMNKSKLVLSNIDPQTATGHSDSPSSVHPPSNSHHSLPQSKPSKSHHFITLPSTKSLCFWRWEKVQIGGVKDEVGAHCGVFIRGKNLEYDQFVERVAERVYSWVL